MSGIERARRALSDLQHAVRSDGKELGPISSHVFDVLGSDAVGETTWAKICKRTGDDAERLQDAIVRISRAAQRSALSSASGRQTVQNFGQRYNELLRCAERLRDEFPRPAAGVSAPQEFANFQRAISWAVQFLEQFGPRATNALENEMPRSRKGGAKIAFEKHVCEEFEAALGAPLYEAVVNLSNAIYPGEREATKELVAKNYQAERAAKSAGRVED